MIELRKSEAKSKAKGATDSLDSLIGPSDVSDGAETWEGVSDETLTREMNRCIDVMVSERQAPYDSLIHNLAIRLWRDSLPRVKKDHLKSKSDREIVLGFGYWPNSMNKWRCAELLEESNTVPTDAMQEARETVSAGIREGLDPR